MSAIERPEFFSAAWWDAAAEVWNASGQTAALAHFGTVVLRATDATTPPVWMHWDDAGRMTRCPSGREDDPDFSAPLQNWQEFFAGRFGAGMAVLRYKINFRGPVRRVLPFTGGLNTFARVIRPLV